MERTTTVVVGAGHAGLAASHFLSERAIDHVVLERGDVANSWRRERWDSLRLLTPNWQSRLPGQPYDGSDPDGYMAMGEVVELIDRFAARTRAPVRTGTTVTSLRRTDDGYHVRTDQGEIACRTVVLASGACNRPSVPRLSEAVPGTVEQVTPFDYRGPDQLPDGGVLVVGASATGVQLAAELRRSGRPVILSTGEHVRMPRTYRGRDVLWWMDASGVWDQRHDEVPDLPRARRLGSPQLAGTPDRTSLDLNALTATGVELVGRSAAVRDGEMLFSGGLRAVVSLADLKMDRLLNTFDAWAATTGTDDEVKPAERFEPTRVPSATRLRLDLRGGEVATVVWATGFRPDYTWLDVPVVDEKGHLNHDGGVVLDSPGLYALGLPVLRRRKSTFIHGIEDDAREVVDHLSGHLARRH
ncbi:NAD(P)-binding domain-containing protein [Actinophytocola xanthii]|uniref:Pyridine nucleotide-disulfide oxidoreductase n=1 Tax=Actinophytocola xanthii TaxID=1912961 RepID=A0A1Q8CY46_9PSEU|nr:NAD(P)-binding domain-containing protein [Actinophytocola xanthii]OLF19269.1 pyridine nucleotide-disulfide oxidoreductase [Actinophytocola xanthii]